MNLVREVGPTALASIATATAAYGWREAWPEPIVAWLLFFAASLCIASLTGRACSALAARWRAVAQP